MSAKQTYYFRRLDNGKIFKRRLTFEDRMNLGPLNRIKIRGGVEAVLVGSVKSTIVTKATPKARGVARWPIKSASCAVRPSEVDKFNRQAQAAGLTSVYYDRSGMCYVGSERDHIRLLESRFPVSPGFKIIKPDSLRSRRDI